MATKTIVGEKVGMTQVWDDNNNVIPVTVVRVTPCRVVQVKTPDSDGYSALQVTYGSKDPRKLTKPVAGHYERAGVDPGIKLVEQRLARLRKTLGAAAEVRPTSARWAWVEYVLAQGGMDAGRQLGEGDGGDGADVGQQAGGQSFPMNEDVGVENARLPGLEVSGHRDRRRVGRPSNRCRRATGQGRWW